MFNGVKNLLLVCALAGVGAEEVRINGMRFGHVHVAFVNFWVVNVHGYKEDAAAYKLVIAAQAEAKLAQDALNARHVATNEAVNKGSTDDHAKGLDAARTAVADYARLHPAPRCATSQTGPAAVSGDPGLVAGPSSAPVMVAVSSADLDQLAQGTVRAESCRAWGQSLIDAGLAISGD